MSVLVHGGLVAAYSGSLERADLRLEGESVVERSPTLEPRPGETVIDAAGCLITPGLVCAHTHFYSALARGMPPPETAPRNFVERLERVWWRLDRAHDPDTIRASARVGALEALGCGVTTVIDHHASPSSISGSLELLRDAFAETGIRGVLAYEITDRNGDAGARAGLDEHRELLAADPDPGVAVLVGAHASFTLSDETLAAASALAAETGTGLHIHVAEDLADMEDAGRRGFRDPVERLEKAGALGPRTLLAHGVHLDRAAFATIESSGSWIVVNPRSNMNNGVGTAPFDLHGDRRAVGTDGIGADVLDETRALFWRAQEAGASMAPDRALGYLHGGQRLAGALFGLTLDRLEPGAAADLVVFDYAAPTPVTADTLAGHLLFGLESRHVRDVVVRGRIALRDRTPLGVDPDAVLAEARALAPGLWARMQAL